MAGTEEPNDKPIADDLSSSVKEKTLSDVDTNISANEPLNNENKSNFSKKDNNKKENNDVTDDDDSNTLKIDEGPSPTSTSSLKDDQPVDYSKKGANALKSDTTSKAIPNKPLQFSPFIGGLPPGMSSIQFSGGILYQSPDQSQLVSHLLQHSVDGKQMRPFKAYTTGRDFLPSLPSLGGYALGGKLHASSPLPLRVNNTPNGTPVSSTHHLMTLATEADKLRQRESENGDGNVKTENGVDEDELTSDGNDSYKDDINELYPHGLDDTQKKKAKKRKPSTEEHHMKDDTYWERRRKNNEAAKRSRDARRAKEDQIAIRAALLEQENMRLRIELAALKEEMIKLRDTVYGNNSGKSS
ncbi:uncharacterized protein [Antedon mediterranea]|uniref:uncharacterized protein n=1 Tax=Antedon mediterranea TaxID=105859 RepID=UPI003AF768D2